MDQDLCFLNYLRLDDVMECISRSGRGTLLAKIQEQTPLDQVVRMNVFRSLMVVLLHGRLERHLNDARVLPLESDVSGRWGCAARWGSKWFQ